MKFHVLRQRLGDKMYLLGDEREAAEIDVAHLVASGVLASAGGRKSEERPKNKAEAVPENKADVVQGEPVHGPRAEPPKKGRKAAAQAAEG